MTTHNSLWCHSANSTSFINEDNGLNQAPKVLLGRLRGLTKRLRNAGSTQ